MKAARFEWDQAKDRENRAKHGVGFETAQYAFADPGRVIAGDLTHSRNEKALFLFWTGRGRNSNRPLHGPGRRHPHLRRRILAQGEEDL